MEKEFVPYQPSLDMKELGFDEPCFAGYNFKNGRTGEFTYPSAKEPNTTSNARVYHKDKKIVGTPLYQQCWRWFREKYNLHSEPYTIDMGAIEYCFQIRDLYSEKYVYDNFVGAGGSYHGTFFTPEEAELECLKKLIEIVKEK